MANLGWMLFAGLLGFVCGLMAGVRGMRDSEREVGRLERQVAELDDKLRTERHRQLERVKELNHN